MCQKKTIRVENNYKEGSGSEFLKPLLMKLHKESSDLDAKKLAEINVSFYFQDPEDFAEDEASLTKSTLKFLKEHKYIKEYSVETGSEAVVDNDGAHDAVYYLKYTCKLIPEKITGYLIELSALPKYFVRLDPGYNKDTLVLNNKYILSHPRYGVPARNLFEVAYSNPNKRLTRLFMEKEIGEKDGIEYEFGKRRIYGMLADLGFKKEIRKIFFPFTSQEAIYFRSEVFVNDIKDQKINFKTLDNQLKNLRSFVRNSTK